MIKEKLFQIVEKNKKVINKLYLRSTLKEAIQDFLLNFVYNHPIYKTLIFTGGTCLRKVYGLPRLSEDLDFNFLEKFAIEEFAKDAKKYFTQTLQYKNLEVKIGRRELSIFFKFPILTEIGIAKTKTDSSLLFVRCDFAQEKIGVFETEVNPISTEDFTFFALSYDLSTLFANKIIAFLERKFFKGKEQKIPFKGRDVFDLVWFLEKSTRLDFSLQPNWPRIFKSLGIENKEKILQLLVEKLEKIDGKDIYNDLLPFVESQDSLDSFTQNFAKIIKSKVKYLKQTESTY